MCRLCERSHIADRELREKIAELCHAIITKYNPTRIILFGSFARGDYSKTSDIDLVVVGEFKERFFDRIGKILELNRTKRDLQPLVYTDEEFELMKSRRFMRTVLREGLEVYARSRGG